jgi:hypothetical protein
MSHLESMIAANMLTGKLPQTKGEVSAKFLKGARKALDIYRGWGAPFGVELNTFTPVIHKEGGDRVACFFTLGVDSFYTLLKHIDEIDDIIYVDNFELRLSSYVREKTVATIRDVAKHYGKTAVIERSDARQRLDRFVEWYRYGHGPALASVALAHEDTYRKVYVPASNTMKIIQKCSTHPHIDHLWSTETLRFVHDAPITRPEKLRTIGEDTFALNRLRVCWQGGDYNCSRCEKCVRTMLSLRLLGLQSDAFGQMPPLIDIAILSQKAAGTTNWPLWAQNIDEVEALLKALRGQV